jgi:hypothetical protein
MSELTELIKEATKRKKKLSLIARKRNLERKINRKVNEKMKALKKHYRTAINWIKKNPGKATGLGLLGAGAGYGGYEAIKHLMDREKKSSLLDEILAYELAHEIIKQAAEDEIYDELLADADEDIDDEDEIIDYLADLDDEDEYDEDDIKLAADLVADAVLDKIAGFTNQGTEVEKARALVLNDLTKKFDKIIKEYPGMSYLKGQALIPVINKLLARREAYKSMQSGFGNLKWLIPFVGMGAKGQEALNKLVRSEGKK